MRKLIIILSLLIAVAFNSYGEEKQLILEVGAGAMYDSGIYKGEKNRIEPLPLINARYGAIAVEYDRIKLYVNENFALVVAMGKNGHDNIQGMDKREMAVAYGVEYKKSIPYEISVKLKLYDNFFGSKSGISAEAEIEKEFMVTETDMCAVGVGAEFIDSAMADYYFGVKTDEESTERKSYKADSTVIPKLRVDYMKIITPNTYLLMSNTLELYTKEISNSPIVDRKVSFNTLIGICYKFM